MAPRGKLFDSNIARVPGIVNTQTAQQAFCLGFPTAMPLKTSSSIAPLCLITRQSLLQKQNKTNKKPKNCTPAVNICYQQAKSKITAPYALHCESTQGLVSAATECTL